MTIRALLSALFLFSLAVAGCDRQGPAERAGENVDEAARETKDAVKDATN